MPSIVINSFPQTIDSSPFDINVTINGAKSGTNYLRIELFKDGSTNYFGETFNGQDFYGGSDGTQYSPVEIKSASTSAIIQGKIGDVKNYSGPGNYDLKIKRYTQSGNAADDNSQIVNLNINYNLQTNSPMPETATQTPVATIFDTPIETPEEILESDKIINTPEVLADDTENKINIIESPTPIVNEIKVDNKNTFPIFAAGVFAAGLFLIGIAAYLIYTGIHAPKNSKE